MKRYRSYRSNAGGSNVRRWRVAGVAGVAVAVVGVGLGVASAGTTVPTVNCQSVADKLPAVPASAQAEITRNLALLNTQIQEANARIASSVGQGGPNFINNAILGPLKDKRFATINRMETAIGRTAAKPDLNAEGLAPCSLNENGGGNASPEPTAGNGNAGNGNAGNGNAGNGNAGGGNAGGGNAALPTVNCPTVADKLPAVPASAQAEITRNLALLNTQIQEANNRIASTVGQGGANFINNAILGPLEDKRFATINRMETAIGRTAAKPDLNAEGLAPCSLNENGGGNAAPEPTQAATANPTTPAGNGGGNNGGNTGGNAGNLPTVNCPDVPVNVAIPASAQAEVTRNLELLQTQIGEANNRIANTVGQGGANFINNAILGPLKDKRFSTINRIETAIGRTATKPNLNAEGLSTCSLNQ
jgi:phage-related protein